MEPSGVKATPVKKGGISCAGGSIRARRANRRPELTSHRSKLEPSASDLPSLPDVSRVRPSGETAIPRTPNKSEPNRSNSVPVAAFQRKIDGPAIPCPP